ncbi:TPA: DEAD/DEAH box helicase [Escherichia coli]|uniref:DEAD/DEAH box helicase n=1 Tax=Escherichia TaxID=561 RepID=UPI0015EA5505|nr:DEAD/DEAH box helicase [Escherichia fergusonii]EEV6176767.1 DEAD/DEAH box helicase [Escherichia coli]EEV9198883.1 DEAD/DEAH box helicase [Escherichia coli]EFC4841066.1 DEAD/DEAH box helicase [Escherichia coli]EFH4802034.1 DEAD/DEAH box helicase [Escherichia coli]EHO3056204.1 DEAD/DEAH box helicase [Escherichia coli]
MNDQSERLFFESDFNPFEFLKIANEKMDNKLTEVDGREMVIRALNDMDMFAKYRDILKRLVRKSGLLPYLRSEFHDLDYEERMAIDLFTPVKDSDFTLHSMQLKIYNILIEGTNVVLSAPTSMGKSAVVDTLIESGKYDVIVIIVPTIALIDETRKRLNTKFRSDYDIIHHSIQTVRKSKNIFVLTQERFNERNDIESVDLFVMDEFYKLSFKKDLEDERVISLNIALSKLLSISKQFYLIGPFIEDIRGLSDVAPDFYYVNTNFNTVAVNIYEFNLAANDVSAKGDKTIEILKKYDGQTIIYCRSPNSASEIVKRLISEEVTSVFSSEYVSWVKDNFTPEWDYAQAIEHGIGIHHGNLPRALQQTTVDLFNNAFIKILICTSTIIEGVNTSAENIIIFDNRNGVGSIDRFTHSNIKGRAGRMGKHFVGNVFCLEAPPLSDYSSSIVDIPLGTQENSTPINLLAGVQEVHLKDESYKRLDDYYNSCKAPIDLLKAHPEYSFDKIQYLYEFLGEYQYDVLKELSFKHLPTSKAMWLLSSLFLYIEQGAVRNAGFKIDEEVISAKFFSYVNANTFQEYLRSEITWIKENRDDVSKALNSELKFIKNIYGYSLPKFLNLAQDIVNTINYENKYDFSADYGFLASQIENYHLNPSFAVLEEMGIPVQLLERLSSDIKEALELEDLIEKVKVFYREGTYFSELESYFVKRALID